MPGLQDAKAAEKAAKKAKAAANKTALEVNEAEATKGAAGTRKSKAKAEADVKKVRCIWGQPDCSALSELHGVVSLSGKYAACPAALHWSLSVAEWG